MFYFYSLFIFLLLLFMLISWIACLVVIFTNPVCKDVKTDRRLRHLLSDRVFLAGYPSVARLWVRYRFVGIPLLHHLDEPEHQRVPQRPVETVRNEPFQKELFPEHLADPLLSSQEELLEHADDRL